jgi:hypothetical protein
MTKNLASCNVPHNYFRRKNRKTDKAEAGRRGKKEDMKSSRHTHTHTHTQRQKDVRMKVKTENDRGRLRVGEMTHILRDRRTFAKS